MTYLERFRIFLDELDQKTYYRALGLGTFLIVALFAILLYWHMGYVAALEQELRKINKSREQVRELLGQHDRIEEQKAAVAHILAEDKTFKIKEYFLNLIVEERLTQKLARDPEVAESPGVASEYMEIHLSANFHKITMQELVNLLVKIEEFKRIYTKELIITKAEGSFIEVYVVIATLLEKSIAGGGI